MIRQATKYDKKQIIEMMKSFREESKIEQLKQLDNEPYWNRLLDSIFAGQGVVFIKDNVGLIMGVVMPTIWCNKTFVMHEFAWWVKKEHRTGTTAYRLVKEYIKYGNQLKEQRRIIFFTLSKLAITPELNYTKLGFEKLDENWIQ